MLTPELQKLVDGIYSTLGDTPLIRDAKDVADALVAADKEIERLMTAIETMRQYASDTFISWETDRDARVGKRLQSMAGNLPRYAREIDEALTLREQVPKEET